MSVTAQGFGQLLENVARTLEGAGVFGSIELAEGRLECRAQGSAEPATYRLELDAGTPYVALVMTDRWQSESIEADLMHSGDSLEELVEEELVDQGYEGGSLSFEHFRSDDMLFTFRSPLPADAASDPETTKKVLLAYEACFRQLGDMDASGDDD
ncbi:MAG: hypothetical protein AAFR38_02635 [Planctomycetota bacterium]